MSIIQLYTRRCCGLDRNYRGRKDVFDSDSLDSDNSMWDRRLIAMCNTVLYTIPTTRTVGIVLHRVLHLKLARTDVDIAFASVGGNGCFNRIGTSKIG